MQLFLAMNTKLTEAKEGSEGKGGLKGPSRVHKGLAVEKWQFRIISCF